MISGLADAGPKFETAIQSNSLGKLYKVLAYYTDYTDFRLVALRGHREYSKKSDQYGATIPINFDADAFESKFLARITKDDPEFLSVENPAELLYNLYESLAESLGEGQKRLFATKPTTGAHWILKAERYLQDLNPIILAMVRDPRAVVSSTLGHWPDYSVADMMRQWLKHLEALEFLEKRHRVIRVCYEDLCREPEQVMREVSTALEVPFENCLLRPELFGVPFAGNSSFEAMGPAISSASRDRWKKALSPDVVNQVEILAGTWLEQSGYEPVGPGSAGFTMDDRLRKVTAHACSLLASRFTSGGWPLFATGAAVGAVITALAFSLIP